MIVDNFLNSTPRVTLAWTCPWFIVIIVSCAWTVVTGFIDGAPAAVGAAIVALAIASYVIGIRIKARVRGGCAR